jgi:catechol 2,3-dioxygenase-like lactoylglutathione lyase family enzyme
MKTHGLTHISLAVRDPETSMRFYAEVFGFTEYYRDESSIQANRNCGWEILAFERDARNAGKAGGIRHFGFRLIRPQDIDEAVDAVLLAGGKLKERGEFSPGFPYAYVFDPDGYEIEIWFE